MRTTCLFAVLFLASLSLAQTPVKEPLSVFPGDTVQVTTTTPLSTDDTINLKLVPLPAGLVTTPGVDAVPCTFDSNLTAIEGPAKNSFSFSIPPNSAVGEYKLCVQAVAKDNTTSTVNVSSQQWINVNPLVTGVDPKAFFAESEPRILTFLGPPSLRADSLTDSSYAVKFAGHALPRCGISADEPPLNEQSCFTLVAPKSNITQPGQVSFKLLGPHFMEQFKGKQSVILVRNGAESAAQPLVIVDASRNTPRNYAIGITAALAVLIGIMLASGTLATQTRKERWSYLLTALFLDEETQSFSLSKCQFYAWTFAAILGYVFFAVARSVIQGSAVFPDIPSGLPGILLFSAGTSVLATGITSQKGSKGAGVVHPTLSDFITTGGVVAPERLQFVVWTVTGIFTFLTIVFKSDPLTLSDLPKIPDGFLQLMGISSAGYLGGKLARKAGPVISTLAVAKVTPAGGSLGSLEPPESSPAKGKVAGDVVTLGLQGEGLSPNASVKVDGVPLRGDQFWVNGTADPQTGFCRNINLSLNNAGAYTEGEHTLTFVNPDAQAADAKFPIDPMKIASAASVPHGTGLTELKVTGEHFAPTTRATWKPAGVANAGPIIQPLAPGATGTPTSEAVVVHNTGNLSVWIKPGDQVGNGELTLLSPVDLKARIAVSVT